MLKGLKESRLFLLAFFVGSVVSLFWLFTNIFFTSARLEKVHVPKKVTLHVFVHGTFGSSLGLLSFFPVIHDNFKGSHYVKTTRLMRKDPFFYKDQPMLARGLLAIHPSYDFVPTNTYQEIAYPLINAYAEVNQFIKHDSEQSLFYTFGWSGFLSRKRRRQEALRLYNALMQEVEAFKAKGYTTKVVIAAHSHGGNIALNLAGINQARHLLQKPEEKMISDELQQMQTYLQTCVDKEHAATKGNKRFDYFPEGDFLSVNRLYLLGTPIQPETDHYATDVKTFKKVYSFYSENDSIQKMDWVSTSRYYSDQRFYRHASADSIVQAKVTYDRPIKEKRWFSRFLPTEQEVTYDPVHRDFWFIAHRHTKEYPSFIYPLPLFVFCPALHRLIKKQASKDITINVTHMHSNLRLIASDYKSDRYLHSEILPISLVHALQEKLLPWQPDESFRKKEFDIIAQHVKQGFQLKNKS